MTERAAHLKELRLLLDRRAPGVVVHLSWATTTSSVLIVHLISVPVSQRGCGLGQRVLSLICQTADARGWSLVLSPTGDLGSDRQRLVNWYGRNGFVPSGAAHGQTMMRAPRQLAA